jgi:hypothetical protein
MHTDDRRLTIIEWLIIAVVGALAASVCLTLGGCAHTPPAPQLPPAPEAVLIPIATPPQTLPRPEVPEWQTSQAVCDGTVETWRECLAALATDLDGAWGALLEALGIIDANNAAAASVPAPP